MKLKLKSRMLSILLPEYQTAGRIQNFTIFSSRMVQIDGRIQKYTTEGLERWLAE